MFEPADVAAALRRLRGSRPREEVAGRAGLTASAYRRFEEGLQMPGPRSFPRLAEGLGCSRYELGRALAEALLARLAAAEEAGGASRSLSPSPAGSEAGRREALAQVVAGLEELLTPSPDEIRRRVREVLRETRAGRGGEPRD